MKKESVPVRPADVSTAPVLQEQNCPLLHGFVI